MDKIEKEKSWIETLPKGHFQKQSQQFNGTAKFHLKSSQILLLPRKSECKIDLPEINSLKIL